MMVATKLMKKRKMHKEKSGRDKGEVGRVLALLVCARVFKFMGLNEEMCGTSELATVNGAWRQDEGLGSGLRDEEA